MTMPETDETPTVTREGMTAKVAHAYDAAREGASSAMRETASGIETNPIAALLGGLALGAAAGVLIARSEREKALLAPLGERLADAARAAIAAGRSAGADALDDAGLNLDNVRQQATKLVEQATKAASAAGSAAFAAARDSAGV